MRVDMQFAVCCTRCRASTMVWARTSSEAIEAFDAVGWESVGVGQLCPKCVQESGKPRLMKEPEGKP